MKAERKNTNAPTAGRPPKRPDRRYARVNITLPPDLVKRARRRAENSPDETISGLINRLLREELKPKGGHDDKKDITPDGLLARVDAPPSPIPARVGSTRDVAPR